MLKIPPGCAEHQTASVSKNISTPNRYMLRPVGYFLEQSSAMPYIQRKDGKPQKLSRITLFDSAYTGRRREV